MNTVSPNWKKTNITYLDENNNHVSRQGNVNRENIRQDYVKFFFNFSHLKRDVHQILPLYDKQNILYLHFLQTHNVYLISYKCKFLLWSRHAFLNSIIIYISVSRF